MRLVSTRIAHPSSRQALVRVEGCGICASSLPLWEGRAWFSYPAEPGAPGHEAWGRIEDVGGDVEGFGHGDRVALLSTSAFADYALAAPEGMVRIPEALAGRPLPGEPLGCAWNVFRRAEIGRGHTVAVVGIGFLGALLTQLAVRVGVEVIALSRRPDSLALARRFGATETLSLENPAAAVAAVLERTGGAGCDRVIEATGLQEPLDVATDITRERGRLVIAGYHQDGDRRVNMQLWNWRGLDVVNAHEPDPLRRREAIQAALGAIAIHAFDPTPLLTHFYPLESLDRAFEAARTRPSGFFKAVVLMS